MNTNEIMGIIEGLLFVCGEEGLSITDLKRLTNIPEKQIEIALNELEKDYDADLLIINKDNFKLNEVFMKGRQMMSNGAVVVKGTFE